MLFQNKYRIPSARLYGWNYGSPGLYFITICTKDRINYFGTIQNGIMCLNNLGQTAYEEWMKAPVIRPDMNIELDSFVVMPNHFHGILIIGENEFNSGKDAVHGVSTFGSQRKNLPSALRGFKSAVTSHALRSKQPFDWQERYHDHIIRSSKGILPFEIILTIILPVGPMINFINRRDAMPGVSFQAICHVI
jgi:putative transposase